MALSVSQVRQKLDQRRKTRTEILRTEAGLGVRELARYSGVSNATISRIESGRAPNIHTALLLARFFETTVEDLFAEFGK